MAIILDAKPVAKRIKDGVRGNVRWTNERRDCTGFPYVSLGIIVVGNDPASKVYVRGKKRDCEECGIRCEVVELDTTATTADVRNAIQYLDSQRTDGIIVQLPLPSGLEAEFIQDCVPEDKDVDCFNTRNVGRLFAWAPIKFFPCTPLGIIHLLQAYNIKVSGKRCVVVGRSNIVGKPMAALLNQCDATVTLCHSKTPDVARYTKDADIIVCAVGKKNFLTADMVKDGAVVIDVGINRDENGKLCGDTDFEALKDKCYAITPVPGGVGLMTRAALMSNVLDAAREVDKLRQFSHL